jgi:hypothetical protein
MRITLFLALILIGSLLAGVVLADSGEPAVQENPGLRHQHRDAGVRYGNGNGRHRR